MGDPRDGNNVRAAAGASSYERGGVDAATFAATGVVNLGPLCSSDFRISPTAASVCEKASRFTAPLCVSELFKKWSPDKMFRSLEANAMKVARSV